MKVVSEQDSAPVEQNTDVSFENEMTLIKFPSKIYQLNRNGLPMICPHKQPSIMERVVSPGAGIALSNHQEQARVERMEQPKPCISNCPLFHLDRKAERVFVDVNCGNAQAHHIISEVIAYNPTKK